MHAKAIIRASKAAGITHPDVIFCRVRDELRLSHEETRLALAEEGILHDGLLDPSRVTLGNSHLSYGFSRF